MHSEFFECYPQRYVYRELVTKENIGSVFYLLGSEFYPDYEDFRCRESFRACALINPYKGWLAESQINLLKSVHFIAYLGKIENFWAYTNTYMARTFINQKQLPLLVKELYPVTSESFGPFALILSWFEENKLSTMIESSAQYKRLKELLTYEEDTFCHKHPDETSRLQMLKNKHLKAFENPENGTAFNDASGSDYQALRFIDYPEPIPFDQFIPTFSSVGSPDFERQQMKLASQAREYGASVMDSSPVSAITDTTDRPHIPRRKRFPGDM